VVAEADHERAVARGEDVLEKNAEVVFVLLDEVLLAATGVDNQAEGERQVLGTGEEGDGLKLVVVEDLEVVPG
jgi:hypothetical protein